MAVEQYIIVGAGQAGHNAALALRDSGYKGRLIIIGDERQRPYERPPLSKDVLVRDAVQAPFFSAEGRYPELGIDLMLDASVEEVELEARRLRLAGGNRLAFEKLLIATGGRARQLSVLGGEHALSLRTYQDALRIRNALSGAKRVVCIGAGVIGLEIASSARALGCEVLVVEATATVMGRCLARSEVQFVEALHRNAGVDFHLSAGVVELDAAAGGKKRVVLSDGSVEEADCVIAGIGIHRNTEIAAGLALDNGVVVDEGGRTSVSGIFAAGDVAAFWHPLFGRRMWLESWHHAQNHGSLVGKVMAGMEARYEDVPRFWSDQHGVNMQMAGMPDEAECTVVRGERASKRYTALHFSSDNRLVAITAVNNARDIRPAMELIRSGRKVEPASFENTGVPLHKIAA